MNTRQRIMSLLLALAMMMPFFGFLEIYADGREDDRIEINSRAFPDAAFRQHIITHGFDRNGDNYLSKQELTEVKSICCEDERINSLKGIEYFTSLEELDCSSNRLTSLRVSLNTKLVELR